jgi:hypothetical protein
MKMVARCLFALLGALALDASPAHASIQSMSSLSRIVNAQVIMVVPGFPPPNNDSQTGNWSTDGPFVETAVAHLVKGTRDGEAIAFQDSDIQFWSTILLATATGSANVDFDRLEGNETIATGHATSRVSFRFQVDTASDYSFTGSLTEAGTGNSFARLRTVVGGLPLAGSETFEFESPVIAASNSGVLSPGVYAFEVQAGGSGRSGGATYDFTFSVTPSQAAGVVPEPASLLLWGPVAGVMFFLCARRTAKP